MRSLGRASLTAQLVKNPTGDSAGDLGSIPGSGRSSGEGIGSPFQYSWGSLVAQLVKNPCAMWENRGDLAFIPGLGRSSGEGND